jgi:hypothetical protein
MDKAARQEAELRQAQHDLELQKAQEATLARELADREEGFADLDRGFKDLQEEVEIKTRKLKKLWGKFQQAQQEVQDIQVMFFRLFHSARIHEPCIEWQAVRRLCMIVHYRVACTCHVGGGSSAGGSGIIGGRNQEQLYTQDVVPWLSRLLQ